MSRLPILFSAVAGSFAIAGPVAATLTVVDPSPAPAPSAPMRPAPTMHWASSANGAVPQGALRLGTDSDGQPLYGCSTTISAAGMNHQPGKLNPRLGNCLVPFAGREYPSPQYHVLVAPQGSDAFAFKQVNGGPIPERAVQVGRDINGAEFYLCLVKLPDRSEQLGKTRNGWRECNYAYGGSERRHGSYSVLVAR